MRNIATDLKLSQEFTISLWLQIPASRDLQPLLGLIYTIDDATESMEHPFIYTEDFKVKFSLRLGESPNRRNLQSGYFADTARFECYTEDLSNVNGKYEFHNSVQLVHRISESRSFAIYVVSFYY
eukprot:UN03892